jgi:putative pre-16S rRNA nuclease
MTRVLAVDFGEKRIGLATGDTFAGMATPRRTIPRSSDEAAAREIARFCREDQVETLLVGVPRSPEDGRESEIAPRIRSFARKLARAAALPLEFHEETLTSDEAARRLRGRRSRAGIDAEAAAVLLEDWLAHRGHQSA